MWRNGNPTIERNSNCDYSLKPLTWDKCPITVVDNYFTDPQVANVLRIVNANRIHAICNLGYRPNGGGSYMPEFRRSADLNSSFFPQQLWDRIERDMLRCAIEKYGAKYTMDQVAVPGGHSFVTIYQQESGMLQLHSDAGSFRDGAWKASVTTRYEMTALIYLNTVGKDFTGGVLRFPFILDKDERPFEYHPKAGDAVFFPANPLFAHSVSPAQGDRSLLGAWRLWRPYVYQG